MERRRAAVARARSDYAFDVQGARSIMLSELEKIEAPIEVIVVQFKKSPNSRS